MVPGSMLPARVLALILLAAPAAAAQDAPPPAKLHGLALGLEVGAQASFRVTVEQRMVSESAVGRRVAEQHLTQDLVLRGLSATRPEGLVEVEATYGRIRGRVTVPPIGDLEFDSERKGAAPADSPTVALMRNVMTALAGHRIRFVLDARARVRSASGGSAVVEAILARLPSDAPERPMIAAALRDALDDDALARDSSPLFAPLPPEPVALGATWTQTGGVRLASLGIDVRREVEATLTAIDDASAALRVRGSLRLPPPPKEEDPKETEGSEGSATKDVPELTGGSVRAEGRVARSDGLPLDWSEDTEVRLRLPVPGSESPILISIDTRVTILRMPEERAEEPRER